MPASTVYLIPTVLHEGQIETLPAYLLPAIKKCHIFFVENERTARRYLKFLWKEMVIDDYEWQNMKEVNGETILQFRNAIKQNKVIGIISEAGCPGIADPGQQLVMIAQEMNITVKPLVGPSSILLALMASGMNGQQFQFVGYLPIDSAERSKAIKNLESESKQKNCTQIFIETPYRNNQLLDALLKNCKANTLVCIACELTSDQEFVKTRSVYDWKKQVPSLHKKPVIFLLLAKD
jgi:16S rRNA (cytidine1402-2'-O)-methyltransferase